MVCVSLIPPATTSDSRTTWTTPQNDAPSQLADSYCSRISIGSEPREATLARLRARLLRMIVENERVRHERRIRPR